MYKEVLSDSDDSDTDTTYEEQANLLELLDVLVVEFEGKAWEIIAQGTDTGTEFPKFWSSYWFKGEVQRKLGYDGASHLPRKSKYVQVIG
ncbi:hypothetical protein E8E14_002471 [Neopestalotiopsis sp. 37M]|nr:hypothetical protein E8E14_002471 [Neopestalotiopsis sp. 37M]